MNFLARPSIKPDKGYGIYFLPGPRLTYQPQSISAQWLLPDCTT